MCEPTVFTCPTHHNIDTVVPPSSTAVLAVATEASPPADTPEIYLDVTDSVSFLFLSGEWF